MLSKLIYMANVQNFNPDKPQEHRTFITFDSAANTLHGICKQAGNKHST